MQVMPYLNFDGRCEEAFRFYEGLLGGRIEAMTRHGDSPVADTVPADWHPRIVHARLSIGDDLVLASDSPPDRYEPPRGIYVSLQVPAVTDGGRIFRGLADGGSVTMPFEPTFWASRFGMVTDRFGIPWMVNCAR